MDQIMDDADLAADALISMSRTSVAGDETEAPAPANRPAVESEQSEAQPTEEEDAYSMPRFTDEEERKEMEQMSSDEILDIQSDLRGITSRMNGMSLLAAGGNGDGGGGDSFKSSETSSVVKPMDIPEGTGGPCGPNEYQQHLPSSWRHSDEIQRDLRLINEEIEQIPEGDKVAYMTALQRCPAEAFGGWRWDVFLEQRDFDAKRTAKNLAEYWKRRLALFGEDRCYFPMTLAGAMQDEVTGMITYDPHRISPVKDTARRTVLVTNPSRSGSRSLYTTKSLSRAFWYTLEVLAQDPEARQCGVVVLFNASKVHQGHFDPRFVKFALSCLDIFPVPWKAVHTVNANIFVSRIILPVAKVLMSRRLRHRLIVHTGSTSNTVEVMGTYALPPNRLPKEFGGEVDIDMQAWIRDRYDKEGLNEEYAGQEIEQRVEPSTKRVRRESSPSRVPSGSGIVSSIASSTGRQNHTPEGRREPYPSVVTSGIHLNEEEETILFGRTKGRKPDPRMNHATILKLRNPDMDNFDILAAVGFHYPAPDSNLKNEKETFDREGVSLRQRKNQLNRRCRKLKAKHDKIVAQKQSSIRQRQQQQQQQQQLTQPELDERKASSVTERTVSSSQDDAMGNGSAGKSPYNQLVADSLLAYQASREEKMKR